MDNSGSPKNHCNTQRADKNGHDVFLSSQKTVFFWLRRKLSCSQQSNNTGLPLCAMQIGIRLHAATSDHRLVRGAMRMLPPFFGCHQTLMKALVKSKREPGLWLEEIPEPSIGMNDVLIRVRRAGICGTDVHIYNWDEWAQRTIPVPMAIGHEFVGEIVEVGSNVSDFHPGDLVSGEGHVVCGRCRNCLAGRRHLCAHITGGGPIGIMAAAVVRHAAARYVVITDKNPYRLELARKMGVTRAVDTAQTSLAQVQRELGMQE